MKNSNEKTNADLLRMLNETDNANDILAASSPEEAASIKASNQTNKENIVKKHIDQDTKSVVQELDGATKINKQSFVELTSKLIKESKVEKKIKDTDILDKIGMAHVTKKKDGLVQLQIGNNRVTEKDRLIAKFKKQATEQKQRAAEKQKENKKPNLFSNLSQSSRAALEEIKESSKKLAPQKGDSTILSTIKKNPQSRGV